MSKCLYYHSRKITPAAFQRTLSAIRLPKILALVAPAVSPAPFSAQRQHLKNLGPHSTIRTVGNCKDRRNDNDFKCRKEPLLVSHLHMLSSRRSAASRFTASTGPLLMSLSARHESHESPCQICSFSSCVEPIAKAGVRDC